MNIKLTKKDYVIYGGIIAFILIASIIGLIIDNNKSPSIRTSGPPIEAPKSPGLNDTFTDGKFAYTITEASREGNTVTVKARAKNIASKAETLYGGTMRLRDASGNLYDKDRDSLNGTLNPGIEIDGVITFEVPEDARGLKAAVNTNSIESAVGNKLGNDVKYTIVDIGL
ncbi:DUF4352 domain-containing protein [Paenibacillus dakarensis]|uniref:DUF4352 domain-containing protein n=1 Tax=Paenibacillus dakarensis TaxID=1527293 RepID=UPI0006D53BCB|nr:DUF4352 domain-containing protein [Paenibacillus dakarensis]